MRAWERAASSVLNERSEFRKSGTILGAPMHLFIPMGKLDLLFRAGPVKGISFKR